MGMGVFFLERRDELPERPASLQLCGSLTEGPTGGKSAIVLANASAINGEGETAHNPHHLHARRQLRADVFGSRQGEGGATNGLTFSLLAVGLLAAIVVTAVVFVCSCYGGGSCTMYVSNHPLILFFVGLHVPPFWAYRIIVTITFCWPRGGI
jgi:hypothetical protein